MLKSKLTNSFYLEISMKREKFYKPDQLDSIRDSEGLLEDSFAVRKLAVGLLESCYSQKPAQEDEVECQKLPMKLEDQWELAADCDCEVEFQLAAAVVVERKEVLGLAGYQAAGDNDLDILCKRRLSAGQQL